MDEQDQAAESEARESSALLFIGLMILLIGFFVLLNNAARFEQARSRAVMGSVTATFRPTHSEPNTAHAFTADLGRVLQEGTLPRTLDRLIETAFPLARVSETKPGRVYEVDLPVGDIWHGDATEPSASARRFVAEAAALLAAPPAGAAYRVEAWLDPGKGAARGRAIRRVSNLALALVAAGAPRAAVDSGLASGAPDKLHLVFSVHPKGEAAP